MFVRNKKYEILTPTGEFVDFNGISKGEPKRLKRIVCSDTSVTASDTHTFFTNDKEIRTKDIIPGTHLDTTSGNKCVTAIEDGGVKDVYDIINVHNHNHRYVVNSEYATMNCDEFAFVAPNIAKEFWTSIRPTLATGGKAIITSTPNSNDDQFAQIWRTAEDNLDEHGNVRPDGLGKNGFFAIRVPWSEHPERDEKWAAEEQATIGADRFAREHNCVVQSTIIHLSDCNDNKIITTMGDLFHSL